MGRSLAPISHTAIELLEGNFGERSRHRVRSSLHPGNKLAHAARRERGRGTRHEAPPSRPKADLLIRLDAPREWLQSRLRVSLGSRGLIDRLFELDLERNPSLTGIIDRLQALLEKRGESVVCVQSLDRHSLEEGAALIQERLAQSSRLESSRTGVPCNGLARPQKASLEHLHG